MKYLILLLLVFCGCVPKCPYDNKYDNNSYVCAAYRCVSICKTQGLKSNYSYNNFTSKCECIKDK